MGGGVLGRFDGLAGSYGDAQDLRVNAWRVLWWIIRKATNRDSLVPAWIRDAFSFYGINQTVEGTLDRRAVGTEIPVFR